MPTLIPRRTAACALVLALLGAACDGGSATGTRTCSGEEVHLEAEGTLTVGTDFSLPPMAFRRDDGPAGFEVELLRAVADRLNLELRWEHRSLPALVPSLLADDYDLAASGLRPDRELPQGTCLTPPHLDAGSVVVVPAADAETVAGPGDLEGRTVGVVEGSVEASWARRELTGSSTAPYPAATDPFDALGAGEVDAVVVERPVGLWRAGSDEGLAVAFESDPDDGYRFALHPDNGALRDAVAEAIALLRDDGTYDELHERWFGRPPD